jgi:TRAP-type C4-dicarboxylate transport system permease small subunit
MPTFFDRVLSAAKKADNLLKLAERAAAALSVLSIFIMVGLTTVDVILRYVFNSPIIGAYEIMEFLLIGVAFLSFAYVQRIGGHVGLEFIVPKLPRKVALVIELIGCMLALGCLWTATWQSGSEAWTAILTGDYIGEIVKLPYWPPKSVVALGFGLFCLTLISIIIRDLVELRRINR